AGIPMDSRFAGLLQIRNQRPLRFVNFIHYAGTTLDPSEIFIRARMTDVLGVVRKGQGKVIANFREIPVPCQPLVVDIINQLKRAGFGGVIMMGNTNEPVCGIPVGLNKVGVILQVGLNPVAAAAEAGVEAESYAMSTLVEYQQLTKYQNLMEGAG
ncbi:MAG: NrpR regulatory domain-containing protein, partial [Chloroflexota bacterium]|nr:NrpR regulatory domain-containing protein [Chloroflexota bacterium]